MCCHGFWTNTFIIPPEPCKNGSAKCERCQQLHHGGFPQLSMTWSLGFLVGKNFALLSQWNVKCLVKKPQKGEQRSWFCGVHILGPEHSWLLMAEKHPYSCNKREKYGSITVPSFSFCSTNTIDLQYMYNWGSEWWNSYPARWQVYFQSSFSSLSRTKAHVSEQVESLVDQLPSLDEEKDKKCTPMQVDYPFNVCKHPWDYRQIELRAQYRISSSSHIPIIQNEIEKMLFTPRMGELLTRLAASGAFILRFLLCQLFYHVAARMGILISCIVHKDCLQTEGEKYLDSCSQSAKCRSWHSENGVALWLQLGTFHLCQNKCCACHVTFVLRTPAADKPNGWKTAFIECPRCRELLVVNTAEFWRQ